jgi:hypothetical protein
VRGQANERCDGCNHLKSLVVRLSPLAVNCEFRLFAGDSTIGVVCKKTKIFKKLEFLQKIFFNAGEGL